MVVASDGNNGTHISSEMLIVWYQALLNRYNTVNNAVTSIDNKTSILLAGAVAVLIFGAEQSLTHLVPLAALGLLGLLLCIVLSLININLREAPDEVNSSEDRPDYYAKTDEEFIWQLISDLEQSIALHSLVNKKKALLYRWIAVSFAISSIAILFSGYIQISISFN